MDIRTDRLRTAGRLAFAGRATPSVHQTAGRRKAIPVPPPRVPTPMPLPNCNQQRNNANGVQHIPTVTTHKKESHDSNRMAKLYLDDNMQQAWINPRLISMINMEAVTSTDYNASNLSRTMNHQNHQPGFQSFTYTQFEEKYNKPAQIVKYGEDYAEYGKNSVLVSGISKLASRITQQHQLHHQQQQQQQQQHQQLQQQQQQQLQGNLRYDSRYSRSHSQPDRQQHINHEVRSKSQDSQELTVYQIDPPTMKQDHKLPHRSIVTNQPTAKKENQLTFYEIEAPLQQERNKEVRFTNQSEKLEKVHQRADNKMNAKNKQQTNAELPSYEQPPKYRQLPEKPPKYQEMQQPPPKYHQDPPKYSELLSSRKLDEPKQTQEDRGPIATPGVRRTAGVVGAAATVAGGRGSNVALPAEPVNPASITSAAREAIRAARARRAKDNSDNESTRIPEPCDVKFKGTVSAILKAGEVVQGRPCEKSVLKIEKCIKIPNTVAEKMKSSQEIGKPKAHENHHNHGYKSENIKYYGELKGCHDYKTYNTPITKQPVTAHEKSHQHGQLSEKGQLSVKSIQSYVHPKNPTSVYSEKYNDHHHHHHRISHLKPPNAFQVYQETKYAYNVSGTPGTPAQASAAAAFFARAAQKLNLSSSPHRRRRSGDDSAGLDDQTILPNGYAAMLLKSPPPAPPALLRRIGVKELSGVGKVKVMLRVSSGEGGSFFSADKRKKQVTLIDPASAQSSTAEDRRPTVAAPKMFAFDAIFTEEDSQTEICSSALTDVIHAVINGTDGCLFCFGHAGLGKTYTMFGTAEAGHTLGAIPCAIAWLFRGISEQRQKTGARFSVRVSCVELTTGQQQLRDLLVAHASDSEQSPSVYLRDDPLFGTLQLQQHSELRAPNAERAAFYLDAAAAARQRDDGDTHMLYTLHVYQYSVAGKGGVAGGRSRLHLIDIGNSERGKSSGGIPLSGLGNILLAIFNGQKHLPYKEHKLAQMLKECLGSLTCHATMIAHISPNAQQYSETLTTCQLASRIHRMRRRKIRFVSGGTQNNGSGGSSGEEAARQNSECDPSSSDLSADTVIYVGPSADDATDGEHPPVYIPSLNSGDNRCAMNRILRGSVAEKPGKIIEERSPVHRTMKAMKTLAQTASKQTSPAHSATPKASPARKASSKISSKITDSPTSKIPVPTASGASDEQWIDGPRISKSKVAEARHMFKDPTHKRETWIDGPMQLGGVAPQVLHTQQHSTGYGFMDSHKKSMIRKWVENQSSQIQRSKHVSSSSSSRQTSDIKVSSGLAQFKELTTFKTCSSSAGDDDDDTSLSTAESDSLKVNEIEDITEKLGAKLNLLNIRSNTDSGLDLTGSPLMDSLERLSRTLDMLEDDDDDEEIVVPPPLPLIEPLSNGVSREVSMESLNLSHKDVMSLQPSRHSLSSEDEILEIVEVDDAEPVPMQDSCLQVTEEDIALCMGDNPISENGQEEHPLRILSQENLTVVSTFTDSLSVLSETERYRSHFLHPVGMGMQPRPYFDHEDFLEQENRHKFDQLARLHELYQSKLALANVANSATYQREKSSAASVREPPTSTASGVFRPPSRCQSLSLSDVLFNDAASNHGSIYSEPAYVAGKTEQDKICDNCRQSMSRPATASYWYPSSVAHLASPRRYCGRLGECNISSLRHPDGASNPNLKEEIERIPGNGASGSDPEEEYIEAKKLFASTATSTTATFFQKMNDRTVTGKCDIEEEIKFPSFTVPTPMPITIPSSIPSSGRMQRKIMSLGSSLGLNKDDYDSGADSTSRAAKLSPATLSRHRAESSGYDSVVRDSETSSIASDSSRQTSALQEHHTVGRLVGYARRVPVQAARAAILAYHATDVAILDSLAPARTLPPGTASKIRNLRLRQHRLKRELREAKRRLMIPARRWSYNLHVADCMSWRNPTFVDALQAETKILEKRVEACKGRVMFITCFDVRPR